MHCDNIFDGCMCGITCSMFVLFYFVIIYNVFFMVDGSNISPTIDQFHRALIILIVFSVVFLIHMVLCAA